MGHTGKGDKNFEEPTKNTTQFWPTLLCPGNRINHCSTQRSPVQRLLGSICAQAAHAAVAAVWEHREHADTVAYCAPDAIDGMHKVVLEVKGETQLVNLAVKLAEAGVDHKLWMEQPENFPTCLATRPYPKAEVAAHFKKCNLAKGVIAAPTAQ